MNSIFSSTHTNLLPYSCPHCGHSCDSADQVPDSSHSDLPPSPEDRSICIRCCRIAIFTHDMTLRLPSQDEVVELLVNSPETRQIIITTIALNSFRPPEKEHT